MRFLADESCDAAVVRALREAGHDVESVSDAMRGATDRSVLDAALRERRVLPTGSVDGL
jgi:predicted nuclease of predicted toxin-antitoxin system